MTELNTGVDIQNYTITRTTATDSKHGDSLADFLEKLQFVLKVSLSQIAP